MNKSRIIATAVAALSGTALAGAVASAGGTEADRAVTVAAQPADGRVAVPDARKIARVPGWLTREFSLFRGSAKRGMPRSAIEAHTISRFGLNRALARRVPMGDGAIYVVPGSRGVCLDAAAVTTCADKRRVLEGMLVLQSCMADLGDATRAFAVAPDALKRLDLTLRDGRVVAAKPTRNVVALATGVAPVAVAWVGLRDGEEPIDDAGGC